MPAKSDYWDGAEGRALPSATPYVASPESVVDVPLLRKLLRDSSSWDKPARGRGAFALD
jgi:hypothetical protein